MNVYCKVGEKLQIEIDWKYLHVIYAVLSLIKQYTASDNVNFHKIYNTVEHELRKKIQREKEAERFHLCCKCFKEIDTAKDKYKHTTFESGYEIYQHDVCPLPNTHEGYEND